MHNPRVRVGDTVTIVFNDGWHYMPIGTKVTVLQLLPNRRDGSSIIARGYCFDSHSIRSQYLRDQDFRLFATSDTPIRAHVQ